MLEKPSWVNQAVALPPVLSPSLIKAIPLTSLGALPKKSLVVSTDIAYFCHPLPNCAIATLQRHQLCSVSKGIWPRGTLRLGREPDIVNRFDLPGKNPRSYAPHKPVLDSHRPLSLFHQRPDRLSLLASTSEDRALHLNQYRVPGSVQRPGPEHWLQVLVGLISQQWNSVFRLRNFG